MYDVAVIGAGPAGLAAAISASKNGSSVVIIEREPELGGILKQCIHDGFGILHFKKRLTGPEYAEIFIEELLKTDVHVLTSTFLLDVRREQGAFILLLQNAKGIFSIQSKAIVLATGCRERTSRQVFIHGDRPAGIMTAGTAQRFVNMMGLLPFRRCVVLGSGDIGLIMARRLTIEGANVTGVYEIKPEPAGLLRNVSQCLHDFNIPLYLSHTVSKVFGKNRVEKVEVVKVDRNLSFVSGSEKTIECDGLLLAVGLIPENELAERLSLQIDQVTNGPFVDQYFMGTVEGVFSCGNSLHVHDLVDYVTWTGFEAGKWASEYAKGKLKVQKRVPLKFDSSLQYCVPQMLSFPLTGKVRIYFRTKSKLVNAQIAVSQAGQELVSKKFKILRPQQIEFIDVTPRVEDEPLEMSLKHVSSLDEREQPFKSLVCIVCPKGCEIELYGDASNPIFRGYSCEKGLEFAKQDIINPKRVLCTTVLTKDARLLPVRTDREIPLESFEKVMNRVKSIVVKKTVRRGEVIVENIENTNANLVATATLYNLSGGRTNVEARLER
ncbi:FAD-dependent oxidoreductase [Pseudothermotoga sp.]